jgi:hypothetical protein
VTSPDGRWDAWYERDEARTVTAYGSSDTYAIGAGFLSPCGEVEDWGCGLGWFRYHYEDFNGLTITGIDGSHTPHANVYADLREYRSDVPGIFMRHVLEHNHEWARILDNAIASFRERMALILFTPLAVKTHVIGSTSINGVEIPDYSFGFDDIVRHFDGLRVETSTLSSPQTQYGIEHVFLLEKRSVR